MNKLQRNALRSAQRDAPYLEKGQKHLFAVTSTFKYPFFIRKATTYFGKNLKDANVLRGTCTPSSRKVNTFPVRRPLLPLRVHEIDLLHPPTPLFPQKSLNPSPFNLLH